MDSCFTLNPWLHFGGGVVIFVVVVAAVMNFFFHYDACKLALIITVVCLSRDCLQLPTKPNICGESKITPDVFYYNLKLSLYKTDVRFII